MSDRVGHGRCARSPNLILDLLHLVLEAVANQTRGLGGLLEDGDAHVREAERGALAFPTCAGTRTPRGEGELIAKSPPMQRVLELARRAASSNATVLITGESGTGKERVARFIHESSPRQKGPLIAVNCGALPEHLLESELFGHKKGAFTGATADAKGLFVAAGGGTLFLDEIGETTPSLQIRLLRALQERTVRPVGSTTDRAVDVRIVAATNQDLEALVENGNFRKDLYYRLSVVALEIPPLRERQEDLLPLARAFISRTCKENACGPCALSSERSWWHGMCSGFSCRSALDDAFWRSTWNM